MESSGWVNAFAAQHRLEDQGTGDQYVFWSFGDCARLAEHT